MFGDLTSQIRALTARDQALRAEAASASQRSTAAVLSNEPLKGSNGAPPTTDLRSSQIPPIAISKTVLRLNESQQTNLKTAISDDISKLIVELNNRVAIDPKTDELNEEIAAINETLTAKRQALALASSTPTEVTSAGAESFANTANPYFLICGSTLWARSDPVKWAEIFAKNKDKLVSLGRSVGMIEVGNRLAGTGFVVGQSHVLTNLHVVKLIADFDKKTGRWVLQPDAKITFDVEYPLGDESGCTNPNKKRSYFINAVHSFPKNNGDDIAVLLTSVDKDFPPLIEVGTRASEKYAGNMIVGVLGYPGPPSDMTIAEQIQFFSTPTASNPQFVYKRLSGGYTGDQRVGTDGMFVHKANTAGGSSGALVIDLAEGEVVGIHVEGYNRFNDVMGYNRALTGEHIRRLLTTAGLLTKAAN